MRYTHFLIIGLIVSISLLGFGAPLAYAKGTQSQSDLTAGMWSSVKNYASRAGEMVLSGGRWVVRGVGTVLDVLILLWPQGEGASAMTEISAGDAGGGKVRMSWHVIEDPSCNRSNTEYICKAGDDWGGGKKGCGSETFALVCNKDYDFSLSCYSRPTSKIREALDKFFNTNRWFEDESGEVHWETSQTSVRLNCDPVTGAETITMATRVVPGGGGGSGGSTSKPKTPIEVELKGPDPSTKSSSGTPQVKAEKEVEYKASVDHYDKGVKIKYRFQCDENKTGKYQKEETKKDSVKFRCTYGERDESYYRDPIIRVEQKDRGKAKDTKRVFVYIPERSDDPEDPGGDPPGGGDSDPPPPAGTPAIDIKVGK